jgi:hypothetical protein
LIPFLKVNEPVKVDWNKEEARVEQVVVIPMAKRAKSDCIVFIFKRLKRDPP